MTDSLFLDSKITEDSDCSHEIKTLAPWKESYDKPRQHIKKQRHLTSHRKPAPRSGRAGFYSQVSFPVDVKSRERQHPGEKPQFCTGRSSHQPSMKKEQERQRDETRGKD